MDMDEYSKKGVVADLNTEDAKWQRLFLEKLDSKEGDKLPTYVAGRCTCWRMKVNFDLGCSGWSDEDRIDVKVP